MSQVSSFYGVIGVVFDVDINIVLNVSSIRLTIVSARVFTNRSFTTSSLVLSSSHERNTTPKIILSDYLKSYYEASSNI